MILDLSRLNSVKISGRTALIGAGCTLRTAYETLRSQQVTIPSGAFGSVGIAGITLGGGFGLISRLHGLAIDRVREIRVMTADGQFKDINEGQYPDLFWACRGGGGGSFGIATAFEFEVVEYVPLATLTLNWDIDCFPTVLSAWQDWAPTADRRITSILVAAPKAAEPITCRLFFSGDAAELDHLAGPLKVCSKLQKQTADSSSHLVESTHGMYPQTSIFSLSHSGEVSNSVRFKNTSAFCREKLSEEAIQILCKKLSEHPNGDHVVQFDSFGGAIGDLRSTDSAFPHRDALFGIQYQMYWTDPLHDDENVEYIRDLRAEMTEFTSNTAYVNYCDDDISDFRTAYYGGNAKKLADVKSKFDPLNVFRFEQSI